MSFRKTGLDFTRGGRIGRITLALEELRLRELMSTPGAVEGIRAFLEKRAPHWAKLDVAEIQ